MDFWITVRALLKQWRFALPVYAFSLTMAAVVFLLVSTQYQSTGTLVLTSSASGARDTAGSRSAGKINPLLAFDGSLTTTAQIVIETLKDPANQKKYETVDGAPAGYEVGNGQLAGPFIVVVATAASPAAANKTAVSVLELARKELSDRQQSLQAPESTYIQADPVVNPTAGEAKFGPKVRYASFTLLLALMVALIAAYGLDSYQNYRANRP
jgi:hypothetical protein